MAEIQSDINNLLAWYKKAGRILPWRSYWPDLTPAYHVFLSEFMLQQTGVSTRPRFGTRRVLAHGHRGATPATLTISDGWQSSNAPVPKTE